LAPLLLWDDKLWITITGAGYIKHILPTLHGYDHSGPSDNGGATWRARAIADIIHATLIHIVDKADAINSEVIDGIALKAVGSSGGYCSVDRLVTTADTASLTTTLQNAALVNCT
jgi:hypothetical protein